MGQLTVGWSGSGIYSDADREAAVNSLLTDR